MAYNRKGKMTTSTSSTPMKTPMKILLCLGAHSINNGPIPCSLAFSQPPRRDSVSSRPPISSYDRSSLLDAPSRSHRSHLYAGRKSPSDASESSGAPFFAQDLNDDRVENYYNDGGGMDDAQQMQDFASSNEYADPSQNLEPRPPTEPPTPRQSAQTDNQPISNVDARVLESILAEGKLNLGSEEEVKKLLEGPRVQETEDFVSQNEEEGKYSSKFVSAVSDNAFWNSLKAKTKDVLDSIAIVIENRIERDSKTLAAVGIFTLDRIGKDLGRALPAARRATRQLLLATNSSYAEKLLDSEGSPFALPSERSLTNSELLDGYDDLYEELTTPADEIRQVTGAIWDILQGNEVEGYSNSRRGVRSFAPAGTAKLAERQKRAYKARKQTVLKREREGIDRKVGRAFGSVSDATWELKREMQTDRGREAGYRTRGVRQALASGAGKLLEAGREGAKLLESSRERSQRMLGGGREGTAPGAVEIVGDEMPNFVDISPLEEEEIIQDVIEEINMEYAPDGLLSPLSFIEEKQRLIASLESCLSEPSQTWLTEEVVAQATEVGVSLDGNVLREVITTMVTLRDGLQKEMQYIQSSDQSDLKMEYTSADLRRMKSMVDTLSEIAINAAGESAAFLLKQELEGFVLSDSLDDIIDIELERMEQLLAEEVERREEELRFRREKQQRKRDEQELYRRQQEEQWRQQQQYQDVVVEPDRYVDSTVEVVGSLGDNQAAPTAKRGWGGGMFTEVEVVSSDNMGGNSANYQRTEGGRAVEIVSDTEYSEYEQQYEQQYKSAQSGSMVDEDEENKENPAGDFALRALDVVFFVGEKFFFVLLPDLITGGAKISRNYARATNRGRGSVGWKPLKNFKVKNIK